MVRDQDNGDFKSQGPLVSTIPAIAATQAVPELVKVADAATAWDD